MNPRGSHEPRHRILLLGSGALQIGQAGEFDYSGTQAIKALREEGVYTVLVNPNIATIQTAKGSPTRCTSPRSRRTTSTESLEREQCDGILLGCGGQTALNCGLALAQNGACGGGPGNLRCGPFASTWRMPACIAVMRH